MTTVRGDVAVINVDRLLYAPCLILVNIQVPDNATLEGLFWLQGGGVEFATGCYVNVSGLPVGALYNMQGICNANSAIQLVSWTRHGVTINYSISYIQLGNNHQATT